MKTIGITGGIASGKSLVSQALLEKGYPVIDADVGARIVVEKGQPALQEICNAFGMQILLPNGELDRKRLGTLIFSDKRKRLQLNQIVHPYIREWMQSELERYRGQGEALVFLDIPLLFENNLEAMVDAVIVVDTRPSVQLERLMARNHLTREEAIKRIESGLSLAQKKARADFVIDNNSTRENTLSQLQKICFNSL